MRVCGKPTRRSNTLAPKVILVTYRVAVGETIILNDVVPSSTEQNAHLTIQKGIIHNLVS